MDFTLHRVKREIEIEGFHSIYYFEFGKDFSHPPEKHNFWEMVYVDSGEINAVTNGLGKKLRQGQVIFHRPMEVHAHVSNLIDPNNMLVISFSSDSPAMEYFDKKIFTLGKTEKTLLSLFINEARVALGEISNDYHNRLPLDFSSAPRGSFQLLECYLTEFLLVLLRSGDETGSTILRSEKSRALGQSSLIELIVSYLEENVTAPVTLSDLCARFFVGKTQLCALFDEHVGKSPMEYFAELTITEAKKLLRNDDLSVSRIADMLSYSSIHNFSRAFKRAVGISPSDYRKKIN